jgi:hypothetical protein
MADSLMNELQKIFDSNPAKFEYISSVVKSRTRAYENLYKAQMERYKGDPNEKEAIDWLKSALAEEKIIAFLEYIKEAKFDYKNESRLKNIYDSVASVLGKQQMKSYNVNDGKDVIEMLKSFNNHFDKMNIGDMIRGLTQNKLLKLGKVDSAADGKVMEKISKMFSSINKSMASLAETQHPMQSSGFFRDLSCAPSNK